MRNLVLHIVLPEGFALTDGSQLTQPVTFDIIGELSPFYASVQQVQLTGGMYTRKMLPMTLACQIYMASKEADEISPVSPIMFPYDVLDVSPSAAKIRFWQAKSEWVRRVAARDLIQNIIALVGNPSSHVLANFSVQNQQAPPGASISAKLDQLQKDIDKYEVTIRSNGQTLPGGHVRPEMAAKGLYDWTETTPSRTWSATGMGANMKTPDFGSPAGGRGKPVSYYYSPFYSPSYTNYRFGAYQGSFPLAISYPFPNMGNFWT